MTEQAPTTRTFPRLYDPDRYDEPARMVALADLAAIPQTEALFEPPPSGDDVTTNPLFRLRYVVMLNGIGEDLPVGLFDHPHEAVLLAREVRDNPREFADAFFRAVNRPEDQRNRKWIGVSVIEFAGPVPECRTELFEID